MLAQDVGLRQLLARQLQSSFVSHFADTSEGAVALAECVPHSDLLIVDSEFVEAVRPLVMTWPEAICVLMCAAPGGSSQLRALGSVVHLIIARPPTQATIVAINCAVMSLADG